MGTPQIIWHTVVLTVKVIAVSILQFAILCSGWIDIPLLQALVARVKFMFLIFHRVIHVEYGSGFDLFSSHIVVSNMTMHSVLAT